MGILVAVSVKVGEGANVLVGFGDGVAEEVGKGVNVSVGVIEGGNVQVLNGVVVMEGVRLGVTGVGEKKYWIVQVGLEVAEGSAVQVGEGLGVSVGSGFTLLLRRTSNKPVQ